MDGGMDSNTPKKNKFRKKFVINAENIFFIEQKFNIKKIFFTMYKSFVFIQKLKFMMTEILFHL